MLSVILIGISLSMDAFAVSVTNGIAMRPFQTSYALWHGLYFGAFQFLMPLAGYILGSTVSGYVTAVGPYVSFALLAFIGGKMIIDVIRGGDDECSDCGRFDVRELFVMAIATSIDALATGIVIAMEPDTSIWLSIAIIGLTTFVICIGGVIIGNKCGSKFKNKATVAGGIILILIGVKILLEHLGVINF